MKRNKILSICAVITAMLAGEGTLAGCNPQTPVSEHKLTPVAAVSASCIEAGNKAYYECSHCDKLFADEAGSREVLLDAITLKALGHDLTSHEAKLPTCSEEGWGEYQACVRSGCDYTTKTVKPATGEHTGGTATCTEKAVCSECGNPYGETIPHSYTREVAEAKYLKTAADCIHAATYYKSCECGEFDANGETFTSGELAAHSYTREVAEAKYLKTAADCIHAATYYKSCECGEFDANGETFTSGTALEHNYDDPVEYEDGHRAQCLRCGEYSEKQNHEAMQLDWGKTDQTCECGKVLHEKLFTAYDKSSLVMLENSTGFGGSTNVSNKAITRTDVVYNGESVGNGYRLNVTGASGQKVIFNGNGMGFRWDQWSGQKDLRVVIGMYFVNSGSVDMSFKYYTENNGLVLATTDFVTVAAGQSKYVEFIVEKFSDNKWANFDLLSNVTGGQIDFVGYVVGHIKDGAQRIVLPSDCVFSDGTCDKFAESSQVAGLLKGVFAENNNSDRQSKKVEPRATSSGANPAISIANGINPSTAIAGEVSSDVAAGYSQNKVLYTIARQSKGTRIAAGCGSNIGVDKNYSRVCIIRLTRISGDISFTHFVGDSKGTDLTRFDAVLDESSTVAEFYFFIPANLDIGSNKHILFDITENMIGDASFVMECETIDIK